MAQTRTFNQPPASKHDEKSPVRRVSRIAGPLAFWLVIIAAIFIMSVLFRVRVIEVEGNSHYTDEEIIKAVDIEDGDNLFFFDRFLAVSNVFSKLPYIDEVSISRQLPNKITITVAESEAIAYLQVGDEKWTISETCKVLGKAADGEEASLIAVTGLNPGTLMIGEPLTEASGDDQQVQYLAEILDQLKERGIKDKVTEIKMADPSQVTFDYENRFTVKIGSYSSVEYKFGLLVSAVSQLLEGDSGTIDISDGRTVHFSPM